MKRLLNVLSIIACVVLSIVFIVTTFSLVVYYSVGGLLHPKNITTVVQNIDYVEIFKESESMGQAFTEMGLDEGTREAVLESDSFENLWNDVAVEFTDVLIDSDKELSSLDSNALKDIVNEHTDDIAKIVEENSDQPVEKDEITEKIDNLFVEKADVIESTVSKLEPIKQMVVSYDTVTKTVFSTFEWYYIVVLCVIEVLLLGLIYLMRYKNHNGFIWIAADTGIVGVLISFVAIIFGSGIITKAISSLPSFASIIVDSAISYILTKLIIAFVVCFAIMIASVVACILLKRHSRKTATKEA